LTQIDGLEVASTSPRFDDPGVVLCYLVFCIQIGFRSISKIADGELWCEEMVELPWETRTFSISQAYVGFG
jgi:hypothetical protein